MPLRAAPPALPSGARRQLLQTAGAAALLYALPGCGGGGGTPGDAEQPAIQWGRDAILKALDTSDATAISVALLTPAGLVWQESFGWANRETATRATPDTRFNIGSVSKVLAALAATLLVDRGLIELDTPITRYLPGFSMLSPAYARLTVRHLLSHSSGLPGTLSRNIFAFTPQHGYAAELEASLADQHIKHEPGDMAIYCNDGFTLFEQVVLATSGQSYADFVETQILAPLGMRRSGFTRAPLPEGSFAHPYHDGQRLPQEFVAAYATGGLCTTPGDMMELARLFIGGGVHGGRRLVSAAGIAEMGKDQTTGLRINPCPEWRWGLGWDSVRQPGLDAVGIRTWQKNGGTTFFGTEFFVVPEAGIALLLTASGRSYDQAALAEGIVMRALQHAGRLDALPSPLAGTVPPAVAPDPATQAAVAGIYGNYDGPLKVSAAGDGLSLDLLRWENGAWATRALGLRPRSDGWWWSDSHPRSSYRWEVAGGHRYLVERVSAGTGHYRITLTIGQQMSPAAPLSAAWRARLGTTWVLTNESPDSTALLLGDGRAQLGELAELPGYVLLDNAQFLTPLADDRAGMSVQVPVNHGRDLAEIVIGEDNGRPWMHVGSSIYEPLASPAT